MSGKDSHWKKIKSSVFPGAEKLLRDNENNYVSACGRFLSFNSSKDQIWALSERKSDFRALIINSGSTLLPVLCGEIVLSDTGFLGKLAARKKLHSVQGLTEEVVILEKVLEKTGKVIDEIFDYDLMSLDKLTSFNINKSPPEGLILRIPKLTDLNALAPLQAGYEKEEVLPKGSGFSPAASRINLANIITGGRILAAELNGRLVGKINVSAVSFTGYLVGGVYVHPDFRGLGIAKRMTREFIASLVAQDRRITLFVKKNNIPARKVYSDLGFTVTGNYRITYY